MPRPAGPTCRTSRANTGEHGRRPAQQHGEQVERDRAEEEALAAARSGSPRRLCLSGWRGGPFVHSRAPGRCARSGRPETSSSPAARRSRCRARRCADRTAARRRWPIDRSPTCQAIEFSMRWPWAAASGGTMLGAAIARERGAAGTPRARAVRGGERRKAAAGSLRRWPGRTSARAKRDSRSRSGWRTAPRGAGRSGRPPRLVIRGQQE